MLQYLLIFTLILQSMLPAWAEPYDIPQASVIASHEVARQSSVPPDIGLQIRQNFQTKAEALEWETRLIKKIRGMFGDDKLPGNKGVH